MKNEVASDKDRIDIPYSAEVKRKFVHLSSLWIPLAVWYVSKITVAWIFGMALVGSLAIDLLRRIIPADTAGWRHLAGLFRAREKGKLSGSSFILLAALFLVYFFSREIAALSLTYMVVGDVAAALVGRRFGKHPVFDKTWEGSIAFFLACLLFSPFVPGLPVAAKVAAAAVAAGIELFPLKLDDNLTVPLGTAGFLALIS